MKPTKEMHVFKSLADKVEDGEVSIEELCDEDAKHKWAINVCKALAIPEDAQVIRVLVWALNTWLNGRAGEVPPLLDERTEFEEWANAKGTMGRSWNGEYYENPLHQAAWQAWQARAYKSL